MKNEVTKKGENFEIDGVVITPDVIGELEFLQRNENSSIMRAQNTIAIAVCHLLTESDAGDENDYLKIKKHVIDLAHIHEFFGRLKSPEQIINQ